MLRVTEVGLFYEIIQRFLIECIVYYSGGLLEERPGVKTRGGRGLEDLGLVTFSLSDLEEDEEYTNPGKLFQDTGSVYTFTNSTVLHPDDHTSVTPSIVGSRVATAPSSALNSGMSTPRTLSRRNSTSTFSTTLGLAKMLNERGTNGSPLAVYREGDPFK